MYRFEVQDRGERKLFLFLKKDEVFGSWMVDANEADLFIKTIAKAFEDINKSANQTGDIRTA